MKEKLLQLTYQKENSLIKDLLESISKRDKGAIFEWYLAELYQGNGWLTKNQGGRGDSGADILLYHPKTPNQVSLIVQAKNHAVPLTFDQTKIELVKFEQQAAVKYQCQQFNLVAVNGFVKEAQKLSEFNMLLSSWDYIANLIAHFNPDKTEPEIELFSHNKNAYTQVKALWQNNKYVAVVQATGTGKSFIIAKVMADFLGEKQLLLAPSNYIIKQQQDKVPWANQSVQFMTYAKCKNLNPNEISNVKLIVLDEFHRCGAEVWGAGVQRILTANPDAYVLGTSATPVRYLDSGRDMSDELFAGVVAVDLSLADAIVKRILPAPTYIAALYTLAEEINDLLDILKNSNKSDEEKPAIAAEINQAKLNWERTCGIPEILNKHLSFDINKFIVFCKDKEHLDEMEVEVQRWFQRAKIYKWRKVYRVLSGVAENDENLVAFREAQEKDTVHLLFAIDMLNEGLHIADVGAVILLRPTESPIIFYQQIGRCLQVDVEHTPIIFDFVNNFKSIRASDFLENLQDAREREQEKRTELGLDEYAPVVRVVDETKEIIEVFKSIEERLQPWEVMFQQLVEFKKVHGHCNIHAHHLENKQLGIWVSTQRYAWKKGAISEERIGRLNEIGFIWNLVDEFWEENFVVLLEYKNIHGHCKIPKRFSENPQLGTWSQHQRQNRRLGKLSEERIKRLDEVGFFWGLAKKTKTITWEEHFTALVEYKNIYGNSEVPQGWFENPRLAIWVSRQRKKKKNGTLSENHKKQLEQIEFDWNPLATSWEKKYAMLIEYKNTYGNCNVPQEWPENKELATWVAGQRKAKQRGNISEEYIDRLDKIGFVWDALDSSWNEMYEALINYKKIKGHCRVPVRYKENPKLSQWVSTQRKAKTGRKISKERIEKLNAIGFVWEPFTNSWENNYTMLVEFINNNGHCNVPFKWSENPQLSEWFFDQRKLRKKGKLTQERVERLDKLGFVWDVLDSSWNKMYEELIEYKQIHGNCNVPNKFSENPQLGVWVGEQRKANKKNKLSQKRIDKLDQIDFVWNVLARVWEDNFSALVEYKKIYGDCNVPNKWAKNPTLGIWVQHQRQNKKKGKISKEYIERLNKLGFVWELLDTSWEEMFIALIKYKDENGHCNVPQRDLNNKQLGRWVRTQRKAKQDGKLSQERIQRLETLGFIWDTLETSWEQMFKTLVQYKNKHGHCNVPSPNSENSQLGVWVNTQRLTKRKGKLNEERVERLNQIGLIWEPKEAFWEEMFTALVEYKQIHGNCKVPNQYDKNQQLGQWVQHQRQAKKKGELSKERIERLNSLGFLWSPLDEQWEENFVALVEYKKVYGNCNVPARWDKNPVLGMWVHHQRQNRKKGKLNQEYIDRLNKISFVWDLLAQAWEDNFSALIEYKKKYGDCNVPNRWVKNPKLGMWVQRQRKNRKKGKLSKERIQRLDAIGFVWNIKVND